MQVRIQIDRKHNKKEESWLFDRFSDATNSVRTYRTVQLLPHDTKINQSRFNMWNTVQFYRQSPANALEDHLTSSIFNDLSCPWSIRTREPFWHPRNHIFTGKVRIIKPALPKINLESSSIQTGAFYCVILMKVRFTRAALPAEFFTYISNSRQSIWKTASSS